YIKVVDDGNFSSGQYAGFDLDAIKFFATTGIKEEATDLTGLSVKTMLGAIFPNPFREIVNLKFQIPSSKFFTPLDNEHLTGQANSKFQIALRIYNSSGQLIKDFSRLTLDALRPTQIIWDGTDDMHRAVPAGVYFVHFTTGDYKQVEKVILLK
ncbi:T9SS type A sorting domain-containing protein, partial [candidate division WOR-3 bacterium]|nr:T9SS type A sorting domain-containing protein [candidate division WOR-3 bacterium]